MASQTLLLVLFLGASVTVEGGGGFFPLTSPDNKIHSGSGMDIANFPWLVSILINGGLCGGAIVNERWVLTAAHCTVNVSPSLLKLRAGSNILHSGGEEYLVEDIVNHPKYDTKHHLNDISAVMTKRPINFVGAVSRVKLPTSSPSPGKNLLTAGWGAFAHDQYPQSLKGAKVVVTEFQNCINNYIGAILDQSVQMCVNGVNGINCVGDSGGAVMMGDVLVGLVSMVQIDKDNQGNVINDCTGRSPAIYTKVSFFRNWILQVTKI